MLWAGLQGLHSVPDSPPSLSRHLAGLGFPLAPLSSSSSRGALDTSGLDGGHRPRSPRSPPSAPEGLRPSVCSFPLRAPRQRFPSSCTPVSCSPSPLRPPGESRLAMARRSSGAEEPESGGSPDAATHGEAQEPTCSGPGRWSL